MISDSRQEEIAHLQNKITDLYNEGLEILKHIERNSINEIRSCACPQQLVLETFKVVVIILGYSGQDYSWGNILHLIEGSQIFLNKLHEFQTNFTMLSPQTLEAITPILKQENMNQHYVNRISAVLPALLSWIEHLIEITQVKERINSLS